MSDLNKKVQEKYPDFALEVERLDVVALKARIVAMQVQLDESEKHREANEALKQAKEEAKMLSGPYNDVKTAIKLKTSYIVALLEEKGG